MSEQVKAHGHIVSYKLLAGIWVALLCMTGITIWVAGLQLGNFSTFTAMLIATSKALLVLFFFMHLKYEPPALKAMAVVTIATLTVIILMTFTDVWFR